MQSTECVQKAVNRKWPSRKTLDKWNELQRANAYSTIN